MKLQLHEGAYMYVTRPRAQERYEAQPRVGLAMQRRNK